MTKLAAPETGAAVATGSDSLCALCGLEAREGSVCTDEQIFCCHGCHAVFQILQTKGQVENVREHPVFLQAMKAGLISNPALLEQIASKKAEGPTEELQKLHLEVTEMWCPSCAELIRYILLQLPGIKSCVVDYTTDLASVEYWPRLISQDEIFQRVASLGYQAGPLESAKQKAVGRSLLLRFGVATFCALNIMMFSFPHYFGLWSEESSGYPLLFSWLSALLALPVITYSAWPIFRRFGHSLRVGLLGMETLVVIGVSTAFGLSLYRLVQQDPNVYFDSMSMVIVFVLLGKIIETKAKFSARQSLFRVSRALPRRGRRRFDDGSVGFVSLKEIAIGDTLLLRPGEKAILDGCVIEGSGVCNEALITGEPRPVAKEIGDTVVGGSLLMQGHLAYRVTVEPDQSTLSKIIGLVESGLEHKTPYERASDRIVRWFVPVVLLIAASTALGIWILGLHSGEEALLRMASILLISCPCAIGIAAPLAESLLMHGLASLGVIVRNRGVLQLLGRESLWVFDKTGTITFGRYEVVAGLSNLSERAAQQIKSLTACSQHPVSQAIFRALDDVGPSEVLGFSEHAGRGISGSIDGMQVLVGTSDFLGLHQIQTKPVESSNSLVWIAIDGQVETVLELGDEVRPEAAQAVGDLRPTSTVLLSGDSESAVKTVAGVVGFGEFFWSQTPLQKREYVDEQRESGEIVAVVGDGINDAPALAGAHVGFSVVSATDISIQVSDVLLTTSDLRVLDKVRRLARKGRAVVKQNLFWAFFYNVVGIGLACLGVLTPLFAAFAMVSSSLIVVFNALRLR